MRCWLFGHAWQGRRHAEHVTCHRCERQELRAVADYADDRWVWMAAAISFGAALSVVGAVVVLVLT